MCGGENPCADEGASRPRKAGRPGREGTGKTNSCAARVAREMLSQEKRKENYRLAEGSRLPKVRLQPGNRLEYNYAG
jgi:hypothetical protein